MKIAPLAVLVAALPLLAQAAEPQASPQQKAAATPAASQQPQQPAKQKPANETKQEKQEPAKQQTEEAAAKHQHSWWKNRAPRPVADRTVVRAVPKSAAKPAAKPAAKQPAAAAARTKPTTQAASKAPNASDASPGPNAEPTPKAKRGVFGALGRVFSGDRQAPPTGRATVRRALPAPKNGAAPKTASTASKATSKPAAKPAPPEAAEAPKKASQQVATAPKPAKQEPKAASPLPPPPAKPAVDAELALPGDTALPQTPSPANPATPPAPPAPPAATAEFNRKNYLETKQKAAADPAVAALGKKLESASTGEAHKTAARHYTKALFKKMNELDSSQPEWYQRMEAATMRRIDSGKPIVAE